MRIFVWTVREAQQYRLIAASIVVLESGKEGDFLHVET